MATTFLKQVPAFAELGDRVLAEMAAAGHDVSHPAGVEIITEGAAGVGVHVIRSGQCSVWIGGSHVVSLGPGEVFGETAMLEGAPRSASIKSETEVVTFVIPMWNFRAMLDEHPEVGAALRTRMKSWRVPG